MNNIKIQLDGPEGGWEGGRGMSTAAVEHQSWRPLSISGGI